MMRVFSLVLMVVSVLFLVGCGDNRRINNGAKSLDKALANFDKFEPTSSYEHFEVEGWAVRMSNDYSKHAAESRVEVKLRAHTLTVQIKSKGNGP